MPRAAKATTRDRVFRVDAPQRAQAAAAPAAEPVSPVAAAVAQLHAAMMAADDELTALLARLEPARGASNGIVATSEPAPVGSSILVGQIGAGVERLQQMRARIQEAREALEL